VDSQITERDDAFELFEDKDIRDIGMSLKSSKLFSSLSDSTKPTEFASRIAADDTINKEFLIRVEAELRTLASAAEPVTSLVDSQTYTLFIWYLVQNLPSELKSDDVIPMLDETGTTKESPVG